jgi:hypothetical protein
MLIEDSANGVDEHVENRTVRDVADAEPRQIYGHKAPVREGSGLKRSYVVRVVPV